MMSMTRGHNQHPDQERVGQDADGESEADGLEDDVVGEGEAGEDAHHDDRGRNHDPGAVREPVEDGLGGGVPWT